MKTLSIKYLKTDFFKSRYIKEKVTDETNLFYITESGVMLRKSLYKPEK